MISDDRLQDLGELLRNTRQDLSDAEWNSDEYNAERLRQQLAYYEMLLEQGELYVPNF